MVTSIQMAGSSQRWGMYEEEISGQASIIKRVGDVEDGFVLEGRTADGEIGGIYCRCITTVVINSGSTDAVNYNGRISS